MSKHKYQIRNIDCENCAKKVENYLTKELDLELVKIDLVSDQIIVVGNASIEELNSYANAIEPGIEILPKNTVIEDSDSKFEFYKLIASIVIFAIALITASSILYIISYLIVGYSVIAKAIRNGLKMQFFDEFFLMTLATLAAVAINQLPEAAAVMIFYSVGEYIQGLSLERTKSSIRELAALRPAKAIKLVDDRQVEVELEALEIGDVIVVKPGEKVGADCILQSEQALFNTSHLTGESKPVLKKAGEQVLAGSIAADTNVKLQVEHREADSTIAKLIELITYADSNKTKTELFITRFSKVYTPIIVALATAIVILGPTIFGLSLHDAIYRAITLLVISCPCAFVLSVPLGYVVAIGKLAKNNILVKGAGAIDRLKNITLVAIDKTGTLTTGKFEVVNFENMSGYSDSQIHRIVNIGERTQTHPIAQSLTNYTSEYGDEIEVNCENFAGRGIGFELDGQMIEIVKADESDLAHTVSAVYIDNVLAAKYMMADEIKQTSSDIVSKLSKLGVGIVMLTGDNQAVANSVGAKLSIPEYNIYSNLMPADKMTIVEQRLTTGESVAFVGDGINDAAVIRRSDIGASMGMSGSALAIENSDIVIGNDNIGGIADAIATSRRASVKIKQNITFAFVVKLTFIILAMFGITTMWEAVFSDVGVTIIAVLNSLTIRRG